MNTVTIDIGNSNTKVDFWEDDGFLYRESCDLLSVRELLKSVEKRDVKACIVSSVRKDSADFIKTLKDELRCPVVEFNQEEIHKFYDISCYKGDLGPDRLAAVLGANVIYPETSKMVVDLGTAMTIDIVDDKGNFCCGNISIGLLSRMKALAKATSKLPEVNTIEENKYFGEDTFGAITCGAIDGVIGEILYSFQLARTLYNVKIGVLTGGDAHYVAWQVLDELNGLNDPYLVGRGLDFHLRTCHLDAHVGRIQI